MDPDLLLVERMKAGDQPAIEQFIRKYYPQILKYCSYHVYDRSAAEDLTQDTFERFFRSFDNYRHCGKAANYLYVIAGNLCRSFHRRPEPVPLGDTDDIPFDDSARIETGIDVRAALYALPRELRETAMLYFGQQMKLRDIAAVLDIGLPLVKYRVRRARELLQKTLGEGEPK